MFFPTEAKSDFFLQKEKWESLCESFFVLDKKILFWRSYLGSFEVFQLVCFGSGKNLPSPYNFRLTMIQVRTLFIDTWIVLLNLTVYFEAIEGNCSAQSVYFLRELLETVRLIFFLCFFKGNMRVSFFAATLWTWQ